MSTKRCYYETLEVERDADDNKLKAAFRKLAMKWHPDRNPGDAASEVRFKEINEAYEVLKDSDKRAAYDRYGHAAFEQGSGLGGAGPGFVNHQCISKIVPWPPLLAAIRKIGAKGSNCARCASPL